MKTLTITVHVPLKFVDYTLGSDLRLWDLRFKKSALIFKVISKTFTMRLECASHLVIAQIIVYILKSTQGSILQHIESKQIDCEGGLRCVQVYVECVRQAQRAFVHCADIPVTGRGIWPLFLCIGVDIYKWIGWSRGIHSLINATRCVRVVPFRRR